MDKLLLIYESIEQLTDGTYIILDNLEDIKIYTNGELKTGYRYIKEILKGVYVLYKKNTFEIYDKQFKLLKSGNLQNNGIIYSLAEILDTYSYAEIESGLKNAETSINKRFRDKLYNSDYCPSDLYVYTSLILGFDVYKNNPYNMELLTLCYDSIIMQSIFIDKVRESKFSRYGKDGYTLVNYFNNDIKEIKLNNTRQTNSLFSGDTKICNGTSIRLIKENKDNYILSIENFNNSGKDKIIRVTGDTYKIIINNYIHCSTNSNNILVKLKSLTNTMQIEYALYNLDMTDRIKYNLIQLQNEYNYSDYYNSLEIPIYYYTDMETQEKVYIEYGRIMTRELFRVSKDTNIIIKQVNSNSINEFIRSTKMLINEQTGKTEVTIINYSGISNAVYRDMRHFWNSMKKIENRNGLEIYIATINGDWFQDSYYVVDKYGNLLEHKGYKNPDDIILKYKNIKSITV